MMNILANRMDSIVGIASVANTPAYLFRHLKALLVDISDDIALAEVVCDLKKVISRGGELREFDRFAYSHALFVLMTFADYSKIRPELTWIRDSGIRWIKETVARYERTAKVSISITEEVSSMTVTEPGDKITDTKNDFLLLVEIKR